MIPQPSDEWALRSERVVTPNGVRPAAVLVRGEKIFKVVGPSQVPADVELIDVGEKMVLPGLVDTHVHINEPGRTEWEGFSTATRAAAAGGITTLIDMPLNCSPVTTTVRALELKRKVAEGQLWVDVGFHGGIVPGNAEHVQPLIDAGVCAFKAFLCDSGIDEFPASAEADLRKIMPILAKADVPLFVHAELVSPLPPGVEEAFAANPTSYRAYLATRPPEWEVAAIHLMIKLCREFRCPVHIVHLSAAEALPFIREAKGEGLPLTIETCPHYIYNWGRMLLDGDARLKCAPPIRSNSVELLFAIAENVVDTIGSDHSPAPADLKHLGDGNLRLAWGGIASIQQLWPLLVCPDERIKEHSFLRCVPMVSSRPASLVGIETSKGSIAPGRDADMVVLDPETRFVVTSEMLHDRHQLTPYLGRTLRGVVVSTYLRGRKVFDDGQILGEPTGRTIRRHAIVKRP